MASKKEVDIAIYLPSLGEGGIERVYLNLARELARRKFSVDLLVAQPRGARSSEVPAGIRVVDLAAPSRRALALAPGLVRYLRGTHPRVILACSGLNLPAIWMKLLTRSTLRVVVSVHNTLSVQFAHLSYRHRAILPPLLATFFPRADAIVAVSNGVATDLCGFLGLAGEQIKVLYNPVLSDDLFVRMDEPLQHRWFCEAGAPVILAVGSLIARKDYATLLHAFARVQQQRPARLIILGEGEARAELEQLIERLGLVAAVDLPGFVSNPYPYFRRAKLFVLSSRWEGLPTNVIEALACGCPVVATDCPSGAREILGDGRFGRLVPVGDPEAMAQAMLATLDEPPCRERLRQRAMDFHVERVVDRYRDVLCL